MRVESAIALINNLVYKPGWHFTATDHTKRFESTVLVRIDYPAVDSGRPNAMRDEPYSSEDILPAAYASFPIVVDQCDDEGLYLAMLQVILEIEMHEAREFLRVKPTYWAPFHPHQTDGMRKWHRMTENFQIRLGNESLRLDLQFGVG